MKTFPRQAKVSKRFALLPIVTTCGVRMWLEPYWVLYMWCRGGKSGWWRWCKLGAFLSEYDADRRIRDEQEKHARTAQ